MPMDVALGLSAHSGWAALVALGATGGAPEIVERSRIELVAPGTELWAKQPYHAASGLEPDDAREVVTRGVDAAQRIARRELARAAKRIASAERRVVACGVLVGNALPSWSVDEILAVHFRMHAAEGALFRDVLLRAAEACELATLAVPAQQIGACVERACGRPAAALAAALAARAKPLGPPWGKDQKEAALAAWAALHESRGTPRAKRGAP